MNLGLTQYCADRSKFLQDEVNNIPKPILVDENGNSSPESGDKNGEPASGEPPKGSLKASIRRWVLTQQMLWREKRLSQEQLRHLAFLGTSALSFENSVYVAYTASVSQL